MSDEIRERFERETADHYGHLIGHHVAITYVDGSVSVGWLFGFRPAGTGPELEHVFDIVRRDGEMVPVPHSVIAAMTSLDEAGGAR